MSKFFPVCENIKINSKVELLAFKCGDIILQLASLDPGSTFELHHHPESQMGMVIAGRLEMNINGTKEILEPLQHVYAADSHIPHGSVNLFAETALAFDVKRITNSLPSLTANKAFFKVTPTKDEATNFPCKSALASWFEIIISQIPPQGKIPTQQSTCEQMGIIYNGHLMMSVEKEQRQLKYGEIYYAPPNVVYEGYNPSNEEVTLIKILMPPVSESAL
ncbi:hypothetical protein PCC9214_03529 [Planktothrix tepida]|uniref:Cupin type-2 domain-containing protein n=2 Tax=Planktothrix TaxID=54304 RepID=A0A1J1LTB9_9CYAN|nr:MULTISPECIES: cupin domain-containing protein [Planktothrix]CAD5944280.1 hypothetical protein NO713_02127 [Planktothrix pseudagardhii]CAD5966535.1 hypothetical protein PCC9214_03529 [Planktothrix tepida]CUR35076.1 conserved hypothetical protein [Planktothrix tepida PCC 9214]